MILKEYKREQNKTEEEKQIDKWYAEWCEANGLYDHLTDKEIEKRYKKYYLGE